MYYLQGAIKKTPKKRGITMKISFLGAAREVTGSCYLVETEAGRFLVDCGMVQGSREAMARNREPFVFDVGTIDFVLLTHAHIDHSGLLPKLARDLVEWHDEGTDLPYLHFTASVDESKALNQIRSGAIIISASGMCNAGRIRHH
ncbi:MAG TPA: MBL fold metallo-hydrolase, partial [Aliiroseovarius sp.]|nr:MBL fold metallo-hydrolase [Aliiroseovarius sp.]